MGRSKILEKVAVFVTRDFGDDRRLLVFRHPQAGVQIPAGTVELGEAPEAAALRELSEEANLTDIYSIRELGSSMETLPRSEKILLRTTKLFNEPSFDASSDGYILDRGLNAFVLEEAGSFSFVESEPLDFKRQPPIRRQKVSGFVRSSLLTTQVRRYFFHLKTETHTKESWQVQTDGHVFTLFWTSLSKERILCDYQQIWIDRYRSELLG